MRIERRRHIGAHAADRDEAFAHLRGEIALFADLLDEFLEIGSLAPLATAARHLAAVEHLARRVVDDEPDALEMVGGAIDHRFEQADENAPARHRGRLRLHRPAHIGGKGLRMMVAHRDQPVVLDDEGDGR